MGSPEPDTLVQVPVLPCGVMQVRVSFPCLFLASLKKKRERVTFMEVGGEWHAVTRRKD
jgi:hypothetical protein